MTQFYIFFPQLEALEKPTARVVTLSSIAGRARQQNGWPRGSQIHPGWGGAAECGLRISFACLLWHMYQVDKNIYKMYTYIYIYRYIYIGIYRYTCIFMCIWASRSVAPPRSVPVLISTTRKAYSWGCKDIVAQQFRHSWSSRMATCTVYMLRSSPSPRRWVSTTCRWRFVAWHNWSWTKRRSFCTPRERRKGEGRREAVEIAVISWDFMGLICGETLTL